MHVDINPGDRSSKCGGMMEPLGAVSYGDEYMLLHHCSTCGHKKRNKTSPEDNMEVIIVLSSRPIRD
jgi:uncharacterized Zn finger protein